MIGGRLEGDGQLPVRSLAPLDRAGPDAVSFVVSAAYLPDLRHTRAAAVLIAAALVEVARGGPTTRIVVDEPEQALRRAAALLHPVAAAAPGIDCQARVAPDAVLGAGCFVGPFAVIGPAAALGDRCVVESGAVIGAGVRLGDDCSIGPNAVCYPGSRLGARVVLKANAVVGGVGFGFLRGRTGPERIPHIGACVLEDDVEIGSATCVDRGNFEDTVIGRGSKLDNLVQVGHNVRLGARCLVMATTGIAGSCRIGDDVVIAGGVGIADHSVIGDRAVLAAKSVVIGGEIPPGETVSGYPARPHRTFLRAQAALYRLPMLLAELEEVVAERRQGATANDRATG